MTHANAEAIEIARDHYYQKNKYKTWTIQVLSGMHLTACGMKNFYELKDFYIAHGHTRVTESNHHDKSLVEWVYRQRQHCNTKEKIKLLDSIDFIWDATQSHFDNVSAKKITS